MQNVIENTVNYSPAASADGATPGKKIGIIGKLFGCWHKRLSRPFSERNVSYRSCLECGARRKFDTESFKTSGPFYYPPTVRPENIQATP